MDPSSPLAALSPCTANCVVTSIPLAGCTLTDIACQCTSANITNILTDCILNHCGTSGLLEVAQLDAKQCDRPHDNRNTAIKVMAILCSVIIFVLVALRVLARLCTVGKLWWDDWFHVTAGLFTIPLSASINYVSKFGLGYHIYDLAYHSESEFVTLFMWFYLCQIFWAIAIYFVKMSILALYLRIFPNASLRRGVFIVMAILTLSVCITLPMTIWQCNPIPAIYNLNERRTAHCLSIRNVAYANAAVNIATELAIFVLPIPVVRKLQVKRGKRIALYVLFGAGVFVIGIASARIPSLVYIDSFNDPTFNDAPAALWTTAESAIVHIVATAPALRSLYSKIKSKILDKSQYSNGSGGKPVWPGRPSTDKQPVTGERKTSHGTVSIGGKTAVEYEHDERDLEGCGDVNDSTEEIMEEIPERKVPLDILPGLNRERHLGYPDRVESVGEDDLERGYLDGHNRQMQRMSWTSYIMF